MDGLQEDTLSTLSGSTAVNAADSSVSNENEPRDLPPNDPDTSEEDVIGDFYSEDDLLNRDLFGIQDDDPEIPDNFFDNPALQVSDTHWTMAAIRRLPVWLANLPYMDHLTIHGTSILNGFRNLPEAAFFDRVLQPVLQAAPLIWPTRATALVFGHILASALLSNFDFIVSMLKYRASALKLVLLGRIFVAMLIAAVPVIASRRRRRRRRGGRDGGELAFVPLFWAGFFAAKATSLALGRYDLMFEEDMIPSRT